jgi:hypothetical protein
MTFGLSLNRFQDEQKVVLPPFDRTPGYLQARTNSLGEIIPSPE